MEIIYNSLKGSALIKCDSIMIELAFSLIKFTNLQNIFSDNKKARQNSHDCKEPGPVLTPLNFLFNLQMGCSVTLH